MFMCCCTCIIKKVIMVTPTHWGQSNFEFEFYFVYVFNFTYERLFFKDNITWNPKGIKKLGFRSDFEIFLTPLCSITKYVPIHSSIESIYASTTFLVTCNNRTWNTYFKAIFQSPIYKEYYVHKYYIHTT